MSQTTTLTEIRPVEAALIRTDRQTHEHNEANRRLS